MLRKFIFCIVISFCARPALAVCSYIQLSRNGQQILILGTSQNKEYEILSQMSMSQLLSSVFLDENIRKNNKSPIKCFVDLTKNQLEGRYSELAVPSKFIRIYLKDIVTSRPKLFDIILSQEENPELNIFFDLLKLFKSVNQKPTNAVKKDLLNLLNQALNSSGYTLNDFLESNKKNLKLLKKFYGANHSFTKYGKILRKAILAYFSNIDRNIELNTAIFKTLRDPKNSREDQINKFQEIVEDIWFDFSFMRQIDYQVNIRREQKVLFILDQARVSQLLPILEEAGFRIELHEVCDSAKHDPCDGYFDGFRKSMLETTLKFFGPVEIIQGYMLPLLTVQSCAHCLDTEAKFKICGKCKIARYCSQECQEEHWPTHKLICKKPAGPTVSADGKYSVE